MGHVYLKDSLVYKVKYQRPNSPRYLEVDGAWYEIMYALSFDSKPELPARQIQLTQLIQLSFNEYLCTLGRPHGDGGRYKPTREFFLDEDEQRDHTHM